MPSLGYGNGAAKFVDNFIRSYYQGKDYEQQTKRQEYLTLLQGLTPQLESPDVPFSQKTRLAKILLSQAGIKDQSIIDNVFGQLDELDKQEVNTGNNEILLDASQYNVRNVIPDSSGPQVLDSGTAPNLEAHTFKKHGDITPRELQNIFKTRQDQIDFKQDIAKAKVLGEIQDERELKKLQAAGWKGNDEVLYDQDKKQYFQQFTNPFTGETRRYYYPENAVPKSTIEKRITSSGLTGKYKMLAQAEEDVANYEKNGANSGVPEGRYLAAKRVLDADTQGQDVREALTSYYSTRNAGQLPIQPSQQESIRLQQEGRDLQREGLDLQKQTRLDNAEAELVKAEEEKWGARNEYDLIKAELDDAAIKLANEEIKQSDFNQIKRRHDAALAKWNKASASVNTAKKKVDSAKSIVSKKSINASSNLDVLVEKNRELINQVRAKNPNTKLTDRQILQAILNKANKK